MSRLPEELLRRFTEEKDPIEVAAVKIKDYISFLKQEGYLVKEVLWALAIDLENESFINGFDDLLSIYKSVIELDPTDDDVYLSIGVSGTEWIEEYKVKDLASRANNAKKIIKYIDIGIEISTNPAHLYHAKGLIFYNHPLRQDDKETYRSLALEYFKKALAHQPDFQIARLYTAHCYHDREKWEKAIEYYRSVDSNELAKQMPNAEWRNRLKDEQLAYCLYMYGEIKMAYTLFEKWMDNMLISDQKELIIDYPDCDYFMELFKEHTHFDGLADKFLKLLNYSEMSSYYTFPESKKDTLTRT